MTIIKQHFISEFMLIFIFIFLISFSPILNATQITVINGDINSSVNVTISKDKEVVVSYNYSQSMDSSTYLRAYVNAFLNYRQSVLIILKDDDDQVIHMKLQNYYNVSKCKAERTICPIWSSLDKDLSQLRKLTVDVSTESTVPIIVNLIIKRLEKFQISEGVTRGFNIDEMSPVFFLYKFEKNIEQVNVKMESQNHTCMIFSIQKAKCPVHDTPENIKFNGMYQSVTTSGSIIVQKGSDTMNRFFIVFVVNFNEAECKRTWSKLKGSGDANIQTTFLNVTVEKVPSASQYILPVFGMIAFYTAFFVIALSISFIYKHVCHKDSFLDTKENTINQSELNEPTGCPSTDELADMETLYSLPNRSNYNTFYTETDSSVSRVKTLDSEDDSYDSVSDVSTDPNIYRLNTSLFVSDLSKKHSAVLNRKYFLYFWYLIIISVFYALPVVQLVITYQKVVRSTGNEDMCYYNFKCTRPFYIFTAFNNMISNVGYVLLGLLFSLITWRRHTLYNECKLSLIRPNKNQGIPQYYGLFYAMGVALTMEGILSACYHICPSNNNFQFDTAYMYILACLCMIKIYQTRHPDVNASAHSFYMTMSFIIFVGVIGVVYNVLLFWVLFTIFYIAICLLLTMEVYYMGRWRLDTGIPHRVYNVLKNDKWRALIPIFKGRMIFLLILNIANITFALYGGFKKQGDFASFFLAIFMFNLLMYFLFYILMKMKYCERFHALPIIYVVISIFCWAFAIYCFIRHPTDWQLTPAESRELNQDCIFLNFYDLHDVWHFLSSMSMFFSFLALQNLDDSLFNVDRNKIPVF